ncbi:MAG: hypothetical protein ACE5JL_11195 [Dehalococcoidia bacterium]
MKWWPSPQARRRICPKERNLMETILTVRVTVPDRELQDTLDDIAADGSLTTETRESLFQDMVDEWLDPSHIHAKMRAKVVGRKL